MLKGVVGEPGGGQKDSRREVGLAGSREGEGELVKYRGLATRLVQEYGRGSSASQGQAAGTTRSRIKPDNGWAMRWSIDRSETCPYQAKRSVMVDCAIHVV